MSNLPRPSRPEYAEYYGRYLDMVPDGDILVTLRDQLGDTLELLDGVAPERETYRYAPDKWSVRQVVGHLIDVERLFGFRALVMAREDGVDLPGMDQDVWASAPNVHDRPLVGMLDEWTSLRRSHVHMFAAMDADTGARRGRASGYDFSVRAFPWIIAGHELWHRQGLLEHYLDPAE